MGEQKLSHSNLVRLLVVASIIILSSLQSVFSATASASTDQPVVISHIQLGGSGSGTSEQEYMILFNNSDSDILVNDWCLEFATSTTYREIKCLVSSAANIDLYIDARSYVLFTNVALVSPTVVPDFVFSNNSNIPGTNGSIRLVDADKTVVDLVGWGSGQAETTALTSLTGGSIFQRKLVADSYTDTDNNASDFQIAGALGVLNSGGLSEIENVIDVCPNIELVQELVPNGYLQDDLGDCYVDTCPNIADLQVVVPNGMYLSTSDECVLIPLEDRPLIITEVYPNAPSSDTGQEFIEMYNPNSEAISLKGYRIQTGPDYTDEYVFSEGEIAAGGYASYSDSVTGIVLPNTTGIQLRLLTPAGTTVSETPVYVSAIEGNSWEIYEDQWIYTNQRTPGAANKPYLQPAVDEEVSITTVLAPCPLGKYRNPETGRCRTIETAVSALLACDEDEYRNPETNRCRKLASSSSILASCKAGQERNPETNRCRSITTASATLDPCPEGQERNIETNRCRKVTVLGAQTTNTAVQDIPASATESFNWLVLIATLLATAGYILYEWRHEISQKLSRFK